MLFSILKNLKFVGKIDIIDSKGNMYSYGAGSPYSKVHLTNKSIERKLLYNPSLYLGEGYMNKDIIIKEGSLDNFINIISSAYNNYLNKNFFFSFYENFFNFFKRFHQVNELLKSKKNVAHHYDLNENMYRLFLDKDMQYSCAYFHNNNIGLDQAQIDKKIHIIKKLQIKENMSVLDIGCGWGGMALQIAKETGAQVKGITLSENQYITAQKRAQKEGLNEKVTFALQDYRKEENSYDRIISVGMFEHVGVNYFPIFFFKNL